MRTSSSSTVRPRSAGILPPVDPAPHPRLQQSQPVANSGTQPLSSLRTFANDPVRSHPLKILPSHVQELDGNNWLTTAFVDILLQRAFSKDTISDCLLIGSALIGLWLKSQISASDADKPNNHYAFLGQKRHRLLAVICGVAHFWVVDIAFDLTKNKEPFQHVRV